MSESALPCQTLRRIARKAWLIEDSLAFPRVLLPMLVRLLSTTTYCTKLEYMLTVTLKCKLSLQCSSSIHPSKLPSLSYFILGAVSSLSLVYLSLLR
jgi:hypothetical protein